MEKKSLPYVGKALAAFLIGVIGTNAVSNPAPVLANNDFPARIVPGAKTPVVIEKENLDIKFHKGPTYGPDHHLNMPKVDVSAHYDLYNDSDKDTTVDIAFPVAEGKWKSWGQKMYRYDEKYLNKILPRQLTVTFQGKSVEVTCETIDISVMGLAKTELPNWKKFIINTFNQDPELAKIIKRLRSKPEEEKERILLEKIKKETTKKFGEDFFHKKFAQAWTAMDRGWSDTHLEHAAVACMMPWVDSKLQLKIPNRPEKDKPFNCIASFNGDYKYLGDKDYQCYCHYYRQWYPRVEKWLKQNTDPKTVKLLKEYSSLPLENFVKNDMVRAQEIMFEKFGVPFDHCQEMAYFLRDEKYTPLATMAAFSPYIKKRLAELKLQQQELMKKWHVPNKYLSPVTKGLYPIGGNVKAELAVEGPKKYYYNYSIYDTGIEPGRGWYIHSTDYDFFLYLYRFKIPVKAQGRGKMTVDYTTSMASDVEIARDWQTLLTQFQYILKTAAYWPEFGGVDIKLTFPKGSIPTIYPEAELVNTTKGEEIYTLSMKKPTENLYVTMVGIQPKDSSYTTIDAEKIGFNEQEIKKIEQKYADVPIKDWPLYIQVNLLIDYNSIGKPGTALLFHKQMSEEAKKFIWQKWPFKEQFKTLAGVLSSEGDVELTEKVIKAINYTQNRNRLHPEEAVALRKKLFPVGKKLSKMGKLYDFFLKHKSDSMAEMDITPLVNAIRDPEIAGEAMAMAEMIYRKKDRLEEQKSKFDFEALALLALQNLDNKNDAIRKNACKLIEHFGSVKIVEILESGIDTKSATQLLDHLGKEYHWFVENYADRISRAIKKHGYKVTSAKLLEKMNEGLNPGNFFQKVAALNNQQEKLKIRIQSIRSLAKSEKQKPFFKLLEKPENFPKKLKWQIVGALGDFRDPGALPFLRKLLQEPKKLNEEQFCTLAEAFGQNGTPQDAENLRNAARKIFSPNSEWDKIDQVALSIGRIFAKPLDGKQYDYEHYASFLVHKEKYETAYWKSTKFLGAENDKKAKQHLINNMYPTLNYLLYRGKYHSWDETHKDADLMANFNREGLDYLMQKGKYFTFRNQVGFSRLVANYTKNRESWLEKYIDSDDRRIRRIAILALGEIKTDTSWAMLKPLLNNPHTRSDALQSAIIDGRKCIVPTLAKMKKELLKEKSLIIRKRQRRLITRGLEKVEQNKNNKLLHLSS